MIISKFPPPTTRDKADGFIKLSTDALLLTSSGSETFTFTKLGNGAVTVDSSDTSVCTASVNENTVTVTTVGSGTSNVTVSVAEGSANKATSAVCVCVRASATLADNSLAVIKAVADAGLGAELWSVGDCTAPIMISASTDLPDFTPPSYDVCAFIIGFDHNFTYEGTGIHFQFGKTTNGTDIALCDSGYNNTKTSGTWFNMNNSDSNSGGWSSSRMRGTICPAFLSALPQEWHNVIASTTKYSDNTGGSSDTASYVTATSDKIWLLAEFEVYGTRAYANSAEQNYQEQYDYYKNGNSKIKYKSTGTATACHWWLRSVCASSDASFCYGTTNGDMRSLIACYSLGFAPGFKIGGDSV